MVVDLAHGGYRHEHGVFDGGHDLTVDLVRNVDVWSPDSDKKHFIYILIISLLSPVSHPLPPVQSRGWVEAEVAQSEVFPPDEYLNSIERDIYLSANLCLNRK